jgi:hypothetical protein
MIHMTRVCAAVTTVLLAAPALAQPGAQPAPDVAPPPVTAGTVVIVTPGPPDFEQPPQVAAAPATLPPQTHDWNNVSHINGQIVKVGEQGDYLYNDGKTVNIASNPIGWMFGFYGASVSVAVHKNIALRGDLNVYHLGSNSGSEIGVSAPIYFKRTFHGPFLEPGIVARTFDDDCDGCGSMGPEIMFGWHWMFDSGLNVAMALGALRNLGNGSDSAELTGYFRVGYAF